MRHDSVVIGYALSDVLGVTVPFQWYELHTPQHRITSHKTQIFSNNAVRTPNPAPTMLCAVTGRETSPYIHLVSLLCF